MSEENLSDNSIYLSQFQEEISERLQNLNAVLLQMETTPNDATLIAAAFRESHTIKGLGRVVGLSDAERLSHSLEDVFAAVRDQRCSLNLEAFEVFFRATDWIQASVANPLPEVILNEVLEQISGLLVGVPPETVETVAKKRPSRSGGTVRPAAGGGKSRSKSSQVGATPTSSSGPVERRTMRDEPPVGELVKVSAEELTQLAAIARDLALQQREAKDAVELLRSLVATMEGLQSLLRHVTEQIPPDNNGAGPGDILAEALSCCGEVEHSFHGFVHTYEASMSEASQNLELLRRALQQIRFVPLGTLYEALPRTVRDLAHIEGKEVQLHLFGGETRLARKVLEQLRSPLVHMIRNAVSHGTEQPDIRELYGKPRHGNVTVKSFSQGDKVCIEIEDDGSGIDPDQIRRTAVARGIVRRDQDEMNDEDVIQLIFRSGFTTRKKVTGVSGRGVGLDLVRSRLTDIGGLIRVLSKPGEGTIFTMELPQA